MSQRTLVLVALLACSLLGAVHAVWFVPSASEVEAREGALEQRRAAERWRGKVAPDFGGTSLSGDRVLLSEVVGKSVVVLNFFATWCGPCREETPELLRFAAHFAGKPVILLGIAGDEPRAKVEAYVAQLGIAFPVLIDEEESVLKRFGVRVFPTTVVVGVDGRVKLYETGGIRNAEVTLHPPVEEELANLAGGRGATRDAYLAAAGKETYEDVLGRDRIEQASQRLSGRALEIARSMDCPCGCSDSVSTCNCGTAKRIRAELAKGDFGEKSDVEIIRALDEKYCVKGGRT